MFNAKILYVIPLIFLMVTFFRIFYSYSDIKKQEYNFAKTEAEVLNSYAMANRNYYQKLFINGTIHLNRETLVALPAYSSRLISQTFSKNNAFNVHIQSVSDRARNPINAADDEEVKAIEFFKKNRNETKYFSGVNSEYYQYANVLKIEKKCLTCHGKKEDAPKFIRDKYFESYDYKLGDVRGIMSIKIPKKNLQKHFYKYFFYSAVYDVLLFLALFLAIYQIIKRSKQINLFLESEILSKTKQLKKSLVIDNLTKLPNRLKLIEDIKNERGNPSRHLALLNIDSFKEINDFYGHEIGDNILQYVSRRIATSCTNESRELYKLPGDEYAIFSTSDVSQEEFVNKIQNLINALQKNALEVNGNEIFVTFSCGVASNEKDILTKTDMALQTSKKDKKNVIAYDSSLDLTDTIQENIRGVKLLKDAIKGDKLTPFYQPIYHLQSKKIQKYEALIRIVQDDGEVIAPFKFLDIAIKSKLYPKITKTVIEKSFDFFKDKEYDFSLNLSIMDVLNQNTYDFIIKKVEEFPTPQRIVFEILEGDKIGNYEELKAFIRDVKRFGCKIAIDDFGSGYSNFAHILELSVDYIKIDASLVKYVTSDENSRKITQTIITFASQLGIETIAEFVEDEASLKLLEVMGVDYVQGYFIGKPQSALQEETK